MYLSSRIFSVLYLEYNWHCLVQSLLVLSSVCSVLQSVMAQSTGITSYDMGTFVYELECFLTSNFSVLWMLLLFVFIAEPILFQDVAELAFGIRERDFSLTP